MPILNIFPNTKGREEIEKDVCEFLDWQNNEDNLITFEDGKMTVGMTYIPKIKQEIISKSPTTSEKTIITKL